MALAKPIRFRVVGIRHLQPKFQWLPCGPELSPPPWKAATAEAEFVIDLQRPTQIRAIALGNAGSVFVEIWGFLQPFNPDITTAPCESHCVLPCTQLCSIAEAKQPLFANRKLVLKPGAPTSYTPSVITKPLLSAGPFLFLIIKCAALSFLPSDDLAIKLASYPTTVGLQSLQITGVQ